MSKYIAYICFFVVGFILGTLITACIEDDKRRK